MKKITLGLGALGLALVLGACGSDTDVSAEKEEPKKDKATEALEEVTDNLDKLLNGETVELDPIVIYDENDVKVTITEMANGSAMGDSISYTIENNSSQDLTITLRDVSVNDTMDDILSVYAELPAGKKSNSTGYTSEGKELVFGETVIEGELHVVDPETYESIYTKPVSFKLQ